MDKKYVLEIYSPNSIEDVEAIFESDTPFMNINVGDVLNPRIWETSTQEHKILKVIKLEHFIWKNENSVKHKIGVMTQAVDDSIEERFTND